MDVKLLFCYTQSDENVDRLTKSLKRHFHNNIDINIANTPKSFLCIFNCIERTPDLIFFHINDDSPSNFELIKTLNQKLPYIAKLIISDIQTLLSLQNQFSNDEYLQFLIHPFSDDEFDLALNSIERQRHLAQKALKKSNYKLLLQKVEEEVNSRFHKLVEANVAKDKILSIISHDLKSPFLGLIGLSDILLFEWKNLDDSDKIGLVSDIKKTSEETLKLLEDLLEWSKCQKEKLEISIEEIKIHNLVNSSIKVNEIRAIPKGIKLHNNINNDLKINADEHMIATVFRNLISNAVKFTRPGGDIQITAKENKDSYTFCVADNGIGVDKPQIIEMFNNDNVINDTSKNRKVDRNGLGLLLCKDFVERSGGKIWLETQKGVGSKFYFTLPSQS